MNPSGQVAVVTGAASGLGQATARALASRGARVAMLDLDGERVRAAATEIGALPLACDVSDEASATGALAVVGDKLGTPRLLVNCAGVVLAMKTLGRDGAHPLDRFRKVLEVNLIGTFNMVRLFAERAGVAEPLEGGERGVIVNTASVAAFDGQIGQAAYSASKGGVAAMTLPLAREFARLGIRVLTIAPGIFRTPMMAALPEEAQASLAAQVPFPPRLGDPAEFAALVLHIVENQMLNGETIRLDGAIRMAPR